LIRIGLKFKHVLIEENDIGPKTELVPRETCFKTNILSPKPGNYGDTLPIAELPCDNSDGSRRR
jgi:hypothetical protein